MTLSSAAPVSTPKSTPDTSAILQQIHDQAAIPQRGKDLRRALQAATKIADRRWRP